MRINRVNGVVVRVVLSKRNLLALLSKLEWSESHRTIINDDVAVSSEPDEMHYRGRVPGEMHQVTEVAIRKADLK